jgi:porphobilinogen deaminase
LVASLDGKTVHQTESKGRKIDAKTLGKELGNTLLEMGGDKIMQEIHAT